MLNFGSLEEEVFVVVVGGFASLKKRHSGVSEGN